MSNNFKLKAKETKATNTDFYNLFRPIAPTIDIIGKVAQVVSALTEAITIWYITQSEMAGASKVLSILVSLVAMVLVIAVLELGGRKFLQVLTRAIVWKRLKNAWYIALFGIVMAVTIGMGIISFNLSTNGIHHAFTAAVPVVASFDDQDLKQEFRSNKKEIIKRFEKDLMVLNENYEQSVDRLNEQYNARIKANHLKATQYKEKFEDGLKWAKSHAEKHRLKASKTEEEKTAVIAKMQEQHSTKLESWKSSRDQTVERERVRMQNAIAKGQVILEKQHNHKTKKANFWGSLFSFFVGFSVILAFICIVSVEVYRRGSGIEVTYEESEKKPAIIGLFWKGLKTRVDAFFRKRVERFAKVSDSSRTASTIGFNTQRSFSIPQHSPTLQAREETTDE